MRHLAALVLLAACGADEPRGTADEVPITMGGEIAPAPGVYPFQGTWAGEAQDCGAAPGTDAAPTVITTQSLLDGAARCDIASVQQDAARGAGAYQLITDCEIEGVTGEAGIALRVDGDRLLVGEDERRALRRCEPSTADE